MSQLPHSQLQALVVQAQKGDADAFGQIYELTLNDIFRYVYFKVKSEDASDLCEDIFLKAWEMLHQYKQQQQVSFRAWLFTIARNIVIDYYRKNRETVSLEVAAELPSSDERMEPEWQVDLTLNVEQLRTGIQQLSEEQQQVVLLRYMEDFSYAEMSDVLGKTEGAIRIIVHRALKELHNILKNKGDKL